MQGRVSLPVLQPWSDQRPTNYLRDCADRPRPCPWFGCQYHLLVEISYAGSIIPTVRQPGFGRPKATTDEDVLLEELDRAAEDGRPTCTLDLVQDGSTLTLSEVGEALAMSREAVRVIEARALRKLGVTRQNHELAAWGDDHVAGAHR